MSVKPASDISAIKGFIEKQDGKLINQTLNSLDIANDPDIQVLRNVRSPLALNKMTVDKGIRPLNTDIETAKGGRKWSKRVLTPRGGMKIIKMIPEELRETFMSDMLDVNAKEVPFAQWVWAQEFAKIKEEINNDIYNSEYHNEPDAFSPTETYAAGELVYFNEIIYRKVGTGSTTAGQSPATHPALWADVDAAVICDGPGHIIAEEITAGRLLTAGSGGAFDEDSAYAAIMDMWSVIPEAHKNLGMVANVSFGTQQDLAINLNKLFGTGAGIGGVDVEEGKRFKLKGTGGRLTIAPKTWMGASSRIIITPAGNGVLGMDQVSNVNKVGKVVDFLHGYRAIVKWMMGFQFRDLEVLYVNDQA